MKARRICDLFHGSLLKYFIKDTFNTDTEPDPDIRFPDGHIEYEVEKYFQIAEKTEKDSFNDLKRLFRTKNS